jgi:CubicO group peptidase (beta-lactamase class C family)
MTDLGVPGLSAAASVDGELRLLSQGLSTTGGRPVGPETIFQAGSVSKPVTALAALRLVAQGKLELDTDVDEYLRSWRVPPADDWQPRLTIRQLLSHTAGLTVHGFPGYRRNDPCPTVIEVIEG